MPAPSSNGYSRLPVDELGEMDNTPLPLLLRVLLALSVLAGAAYYWSELTAVNRFLVFAFSIIMWSVVSTGAWKQNHRDYRRRTDALQKQELNKAWSTFKNAAVGKDAIEINKLGGRKKQR